MNPFFLSYLRGNKNGKNIHHMCQEEKQPVQLSAFISPLVWAVLIFGTNSRVNYISKFSSKRHNG